MKKSQLRQLIRESIKELVNEVTETGKNITASGSCIIFFLWGFIF
jgi:hypothetical protein